MRYDSSDIFSPSGGWGEHVWREQDLWPRGRELKTEGFRHELYSCGPEILSLYFYINLPDLCSKNLSILYWILFYLNSCAASQQKWRLFTTPRTHHSLQTNMSATNYNNHRDGHVHQLTDHTTSHCEVLALCLTPIDTKCCYWSCPGSSPDLCLCFFFFKSYWCLMV